MNPEHLKKIEKIFHQALEKSEEDRQSFVEAECQGDTVLLDELNTLLKTANSNDSIGEIIQNNAKQLKELNDPWVGQTIDQYEILEEIAVGGMGAVYIGKRTDSEYHQRVAIKLMSHGLVSKQARQRFLSERQILANLSHPNIASLLDGGTTDSGVPYLVMEFIEGEPIDKYCDNNKLTIKQRIQLMLKVCSAIQYAHQNLVIHRDIKTSNILVTKEGVPKLLDFGIAKLLDQQPMEHTVALTRTEMRLLTPEYASPEQIRGETISTATDVYGVGILLFKLLTGYFPFMVSSYSPAELEQLICKQPPPKPSAVITKYKDHQISDNRKTHWKKLQNDIKGDLDNIILLALSKEKSMRYNTIDSMAEDLRNFLNLLPITAQAPSFKYRFNKFIRRNSLAVTVTTGIFVAVAGLVSFYTWQLSEQRDIAIIEKEKADQIASFVTGLFEVSNPSESKGEKITAIDLLESGINQIDHELSEQPEVKLMMKRVVGEVFYNLGAELKSKDILSKTLSEQLRLHGEKHLEVAITKILLGFIHQDRGEFELAEPLFKSAYSTQIDILKNDHFELVETLNILATFEQMRGNYKKAEAQFREALSMANRISDTKNEIIAENMKNLGGVLRIQDKNVEAETLLREALKLQKKLYEKAEHPEIDDTKRELAGLLRQTRRFEESELLYIEVIESRTKMLGNSHIEVANVWNSYSHLLGDIGKNDKALDANQTMIDIMNRAYPGPHPSLGAAYHNRALMLKDNGQMDKAIEYFDLSINMQDQIGLPEKHANRAYPLSGKGRILLNQEKFTEAHAIYSEVLSIRRGAFDEKHILVTETKSSLAAALTGLEKFDKAQALLVECYDRFFATRNKDDPRLELVARRLIHLFKKKGDTKATAEFEKQLIKDGVSI